MKKSLTECFHIYRHLKNQNKELPPGDERSYHGEVLAQMHREIVRGEVELEKGRAIDHIVDRIHELISFITN